MSESHVVDLQATVDWTTTQWPLAKTWMLGVNHGALSAARGDGEHRANWPARCLLACSDEAFDQPQKSDRMRDARRALPPRQ